jgi:FAD/FMN-containing dehydrogenase/Fe-S oxidoreductase
MYSMKQAVIINETARTHMPHSNVRGGQMESSVIDVEGLEHDLREQLRGEVRFDDGSRALYATDASQYRQVPIGVVLPKDEDDAINAVAVCHRYGAPIVMRGGGTSLAGQGCNVAVLIDMSKYMNKLLDLDPHQKTARVQPGIILDTLRNAAEQYTLTFGPDPATHNHCTLGGMIGNNSCGTHALMAGKTADNIEELDILTYDGLRLQVGQTSEEELEQIITAGGRRGEIYGKLKGIRDRYGNLIRERFPKIPRRVSGYNLNQLLPENGFNVARALVGTESTCVIVLGAKTRLVYSPPKRTMVVLGYPDIYSACDHLMVILAHNPIALEGFDNFLVDDMKKKGMEPADVALLPPGGGWLIVEFGASSRDEANDQAHKLMDELKGKPHAPQMKMLDDSAQEAKIWQLRESALAASSFVPGQKPTWPGWEDSAVAPEKFANYLRDLRKLLDDYGYHADFYGHFGQGCLHERVDFDFMTAQGIRKYRSFIEKAADLVVKYGGSFSGEHGDGQARAELLPKMFGDELIEAFREFKSAWDPQWKMNPGKMVNAYRIDQNLRLGTDYNPMPVKTHFKFPADEWSFARATQRCVGVGKCRRLGGGTMCPSFMVTREEADTTRGRAHLLFEMMRGDAIKPDWHDESVKDALDLCLACKGCKGDCPVNVDMATYKAEFLSHYYEGKLRPMSGYSMGWIYWWSRLAALAPGLVNFVTQAPILSSIAKALGGIAPQRKMPKFAPQTFKAWFFAREERNVGGPDVILWPDTFNNNFHPATAVAAVEVLESVGYHVIVPRQSLCCGRPLYDFGFLDMAEHLLLQLLTTLRPQIQAGIPVVGLEPSCVSVFRDEMKELLPHDEDALRLSGQTFLLSEFLEQKVENYQPPKLRRKAVVHGHCHHKSVLKMNAEESILQKLGLDYHVLDSGCCGMAGAFGFEPDHYDVSIKAGERVLLPAVREADKQTLIITDGFSCREQISQTTDRQALHLAQVLQMALHEQRSAATQAPAYPEQAYTQDPEPSFSKTARTVLVAIGAMAASSVGILLWRRSRSG